ncbi:MAG: alpha/beta hydrolase-fold protein, partial [Acidobacteriota bacterium]|nr:alpha/beta hydrolase-fold protein [Acidobacteriota bacterium]
AYIDARGGTPVVESQSRAIFLVQDRDGVTPRVVGDFNNWASAANGQDPSIGVPTRLDGTDWSYLEASIYTNARAEYVLFFPDQASIDPHNPRTVAAFAGPRSEVRMPQWIPQPEIDLTVDVPAGALAAETLESTSLVGSRRVWFYTPPGYETSRAWYPVLYVLDGGNYVEHMAAPTILDRLIARKAIEPVVAVFVEPAERQEEYSRSAPWRAFMATELVPLVDKRFRTFPAPEKRVILGSSLSAYGAVDLAVEYPGTFGLCAALAPPAQTPTVITNQAKGQDAIRAVRFFILAGTYDAMANGGRRLRSALGMGAGAVTYLEVPEGHSSETFRGHLDDALTALLAVTPS